MTTAQPSSAAKLPSAKERHGAEVLHHLETIAPRSESTRAIADATGLSISQTYSGLLWVKEEGAAAIGKALVSSRKEGQGLPDEEEPVEDFVTKQMVRAYNVLYRLFSGTIVGWRHRWPDNEFAELIEIQADNLLRTLKTVIDQGQRRRNARRKEALRLAREAKKRRAAAAG